MIEFDESLSRRLPVFIVIDTSGSMHGSGIEAVNQGVQLLIDELRHDPQAIENAWISILTFNNEARIALPLTEVLQVIPPSLQAGGETNYGSAFDLLLQQIEQTVRPNTAAQKGDWKPLIFFFSDGQPTYLDWEPLAEQLKQRVDRKSITLISLAAGRKVNTATFKLFSTLVLEMPEITPDTIRSFFKWISQSVKVSSKSASAPPVADQNVVTLPPVPAGIQIVI